MNSAIHQFSLRIPVDLWEQLEKRCKRLGITGFILEAIDEKLNQENQLSQGSQSLGHRATNPES